MKHYGLIGYPLGHSFSKSYFTEKFRDEHIGADYELYPIEHKKELKPFLSSTHWHAFNVTIPWKEEIIPFLDELDPLAQQIGAVNCVVRCQAGWKGYNTDVIGFEKALEAFTSLHKKKALVFGHGGSAKAVQYVLNKHKVPYSTLSRNPVLDTIGYDELTQELAAQHTLWINTTPVGMFPLVDDHLPLPFQVLNSEYYVFDLIYNPEKTTLLALAEMKGAHITNGKRMLIEQAEAAYTLFTNQQIS